MQLPRAANAPRFEDGLYACGITVPAEPGIMTLVAGFSNAVDARLPGNRGRTDPAEMAQMAAAETLAAVLSERTRGFFDTSPDDVRRELGRLGTVKQFGGLARSFFARLTYKCLDYYLSRALADQVGADRRFINLARLGEFSSALETHCREAAYVVERFTGEWLSKSEWEKGRVSRDDAHNLVCGAMAKLICELRSGAGIDVN
jgi:hypothetical protein